MKNEAVAKVREAYLSFLLDEEIFAINVKKVLEVLQIQKITKVPQTPTHLRGVTNFRGDILPVVDSRTRLNLPTIEDSDKTIIIVLDMEHNNNKLLIGALADSVKDVIQIADDEILPVPEVGNKFDAEYLSGMYRYKDSFVMILNVDKVFSVNNLVTVANQFVGIRN